MHKTAETTVCKIVGENSVVLESKNARVDYFKDSRIHVTLSDIEACYILNERRSIAVSRV